MLANDIYEMLRRPISASAEKAAPFAAKGRIVLDKMLTPIGDFVAKNSSVAKALEMNFL